MIAPIYLLLLLGEHGPVGPVQREFVRLASPITLAVAASSALAAAVAAASAITTTITAPSAIDIEDYTP